MCRILTNLAWDFCHTSYKSFIFHLTYPKSLIFLQATTNNSWISGFLSKYPKIIFICFQGNTLSVERAKFEMKGDAYDPKLKPKKLSKRDKEKALRQKERLFAWVPDKMKGERAKHDKVIVIKNLFDPAEFSRDPGLIIDYTSRIRSQCSKFGTCTKVCIYDKENKLSLNFSDFSFVLKWNHVNDLYNQINKTIFPFLKDQKYPG